MQWKPVCQCRLGARIVGTCEYISYLNEPELGESIIIDC